MFYILFYLCIIVIRKFVFTENILKYKHCIITTKEVYCILYLEHVYCLMTVKQLTKLTRYSLLYSDRGIQVQYLTYISNLSNKICWSHCGLKVSRSQTKIYENFANYFLKTKAINKCLKV